MTKRPKENTPLSAAQLYRDRLNKMKDAKNVGQTKSVAHTNTHNRLANTSPSSTARKAKKGFRPG